ncbi:MAG: purine-nucleoside phosphorylase [Candidatus Reconcilbacillus cellulovorans]|uniref:Purine nucleoside phosphorylase n=1 Tax=Candidatus Reconcilbacillus cellulovorans TaxID=1906605 RepID=A0A2A6E2B4_9BACL|nr:MAG: purine-nucleoside phosphorylase [Candidatus Reconcilbacillus cellulovorans]
MRSGSHLRRSAMIDEAAAYVRSRLVGPDPEIGLILGSGLGDLADEAESATAIAYADIPHFPVSTVEGHAGRLVVGTLEGRRVVCMQGRFHYYEGYSMEEVVRPVYMMKRLGVRTLVVTNAAGGLSRAFRPGDLMVIRDHINLTGANPLVGPNDPALGPRFPDMSEAYSRRFRDLARAAAARLGLAVGPGERHGERVGERDGGQDRDSPRLQEGVYCGIAGPSYLTPAELAMLVRIGADAVGMSTVAEVIAARHAGLEVFGVSCITDMAIPDELEPLTHEQVVAVAERTKPVFARFLREWLRLLGADESPAGGGAGSGAADGAGGGAA